MRSHEPVRPLPTHELRLRHGIHQTELAELLGYEQSYISALEIGTKGPPTPEFFAKLAQSFDMRDAEQHELEQIAEASQRKLALDTDSQRISKRQNRLLSVPIRKTEVANASNSIGYLT